jgi:ubiquinone biosynthesis protein UbiJ
MNSTPLVFTVDSAALIGGLTTAAITLGGAMISVTKLILGYFKTRDENEKANTAAYLEKVANITKEHQASLEEERTDRRKAQEAVMSTIASLTAVKDSLEHLADRVSRLEDK